MRVTALKPQQRHADRVDLYVDGAFRCGLAAELVLGAGLHVGAELDEAALEALERRDLLWKTRESAFNLLSYRARSETELRRRLLRKGYPEEIVGTCIAQLADRGLIDDAGFAASFVRDRVRLRPRGPRRLVQELRARGVEDDLARIVVQDVFEGEEVSELDLARDAAAAWTRRSLPRVGESADAATGDSWNARKRLYGYLARRGFGTDVIRTVVAEVIG